MMGLGDVVNQLQSKINHNRNKEQFHSMGKNLPNLGKGKPPCGDLTFILDLPKSLVDVLSIQTTKVSEAVARLWAAKACDGRKAGESLSYESTFVKSVHDKVAWQSKNVFESLH